MFTRSILLTAFAAAALSVSAVSAMALEIKPYDQKSFAAAQAAGAATLVDVYAGWCPTCKAQRSVLKGLEANPAYKDVTVFSVDFDNQADVVKALGADKQSTLIAYKGKTETSRSVGETSAKGIEAMLSSTMK